MKSSLNIHKGRAPERESACLVLSGVTFPKTVLCQFNELQSSTSTRAVRITIHPSQKKLRLRTDIDNRIKLFTFLLGFAYGYSPTQIYGATAPAP